MKEKWKITHSNGTTEYATLEQWTNNEFFVDMNCCLWNRVYKSYNWARKYLEKCGYTKVNTEN